jgi:hypothetical protein
MNAHRTCLCLILAVGTALFAGTGAAQSERADTQQSTRSAAQKLYREGVRAYGRGDYLHAIERFNAADRVQPSAAFSFNIAKAYDALNDTSRALSAYRAYLRRSETPADAEGVQASIDALAAKLASDGVQQVTVLSAPDGANAFLDSEPLGKTPATVDVTPGKHEVTLRLPGYESVSTEVDVARDKPLDVGFALIAADPAQASLQQLGAAPARVVASQASTTTHNGGGVTAASETRPNQTLRTVGFATLGAGVAALGTALAFEILRSNADDAAKSERQQIRLADDIDSMHSRQTLARVFVGAGGSLAAVGGVLLLAAYASPEKKPREGLAIACLPSRCHATLSGTF